MNALIVFREEDADNLFVPILCEGIRQQGIDVNCSLRDFWESDKRYDIIHFQWPEEVVGWNCHEWSAIEKLEQRIKYFRSHGSRFVYTRHNICPHYNSNEVIRAAYEIIESCSDVIVHMGHFSRDEFRDKRPKAHHTIIPHHIYEHAYIENISREEARRKLNIPADRFVITSFGKFRDKEEIELVVRAYRQFKCKQKFLLAPRMFPFSKHPGHKSWLKRLASMAGYHVFIPVINRWWNMKTGANDELISNDDLPYYISASDVVFIQRKKILNSGNVPLALLFHKVVVGPQTGNVGELLRETGNPTFDADHTQSVVNALQKAAQLCNENRGEQNYQYAIANLGVARIGNAYAQVYRQAITPAGSI